MIGPNPNFPKGDAPEVATQFPEREIPRPEWEEATGDHELD